MDSSFRGNDKRESDSIRRSVEIKIIDNGQLTVDNY